MFSAFKNQFHNPTLPPSNKALAALRAALSAPYPPGGASNSPLNFNLEVIENAPPNADQIRTILDYLPHLRIRTTHTSCCTAFSGRLVRLAQKSPLAFKWPIVVDWTSGRATAGDSEGVKDILEYLRKRGMGS
ncbi:hypothetical protein BGY98DRAFT_977488 [Russula aff. rugulosa BPL654]|nr:hypothetical protein BGY98DRAFT_977488 [Russula aff. rugulosa BPL654]